MREDESIIPQEETLYPEGNLRRIPEPYGGNDNEIQT